VTEKKKATPIQGRRNYAGYAHCECWREWNFCVAKLFGFAAEPGDGLVARQHAPTEKDQDGKPDGTIALLHTELSIRFYLTEALEFGFWRDLLSFHVELIFSAGHTSFYQGRPGWR
jgi:hypothetical protein